MLLLIILPVRWCWFSSSQIMCTKCKLDSFAQCKIVTTFDRRFSFFFVEESRLWIFLSIFIEEIPREFLCFMKIMNIYSFFIMEKNLNEFLTQKKSSKYNFTKYDGIWYQPWCHIVIILKYIKYFFPHNFPQNFPKKLF